MPVRRRAESDLRTDGRRVGPKGTLSGQERLGRAGSCARRTRGMLQPACFISLALPAGCAAAPPPQQSGYHLTFVIGASIEHAEIETIAKEAGDPDESLGHRGASVGNNESSGAMGKAGEDHARRGDPSTSQQRPCRFDSRGQIIARRRAGVATEQLAGRARRERHVRPGQRVQPHPSGGLSPRLRCSDFETSGPQQLRARRPSCCRKLASCHRP